MSAIRQQINNSLPTIYTEHYSQVTVVYGRLVGLEDILARCSVQDGARLLNELQARIDQIVKRCGCIRIQSDAIVVISGIPTISDNHLQSAVSFAIDVESLISSFCNATCAELGFRCGIEYGSVTAGIIGQLKWHYDIIGATVEEAIKIQNSVSNCGVYISENVKRKSDGCFLTEKCENFWRALPVQSDGLPPSLLFPNLRRFSLVTVPQSINRLLQAISSSNDSLLRSNGIQGRRKRKAKKLVILSEKCNLQDVENSCMNQLTLRFKSDEMENAVKGFTFFNSQFNQWFIPGLAVSILFLVVYGIYHALILPRHIATLALVIVALVAVFIVLLMLYINCFQHFCQFITRTAVGNSVAILLVISLLFVSGVVNAVSFVSTSALLSIEAFLLLAVERCHFNLNFSSPLLKWELLDGLLTLIAIIYIHARRNEHILRLEFISQLKESEEKVEYSEAEEANQKLLANALPAHLAQNFFLKPDLYHHLSHSVGIAYINISMENDDGEAAINNLKNIVAVFDQILLQHEGVEKILNTNRTYIAAVGVLPEISKNVHDTPSVIGELLAELTQFALDISAFAADHGITLNIGIDCGPVLSVVVNANQPSYEVYGSTCLRAHQLMQHADCYGIMVSEEIFLALRPRDFSFDSRPIKIFDDLTAYVFDDCYPDKNIEAETRAVTLPLENTRDNQLEMMTSLNSSFSSEIYSVDVGGVETDSEMEWITPEMLQYERRDQPSTSAMYSSEFIYVPTDDSECDRSITPEWSLKKKRLKKSRYPGWLSRSMTSDTSRSRIERAERLAAAASRVDRMLEELNAVAGFDTGLDCRPFPTSALSASSRSIRRELSSACHTEYDNAESEGVFSDSEMLDNPKKPLKNLDSRKKRRRLWSNVDNGNDADIDSVCSSLNVSSIFSNFRWNSVHSIGYDNEYEIASSEDLRELARSQMEALSRDIRSNFGDYQLATFSDNDS
uniref:adenylate cyclase n=1 Tax=Syphacia muris TaxID=451379 RepID=A0A158R3X7_9BILA